MGGLPLLTLWICVGARVPQAPNSPGKSANMNVVKRLTKLLYGGGEKDKQTTPAPARR